MTRVLLLIATLCVAGCGDSPASLGITGPGIAPSPPPGADDSTIPNPGIPNGGGYGPGLGPTPSSGRYFDYN
jgi:hypothetical protein